MSEPTVVEGELNIEQITWNGLTWVNIEKPTPKETEYLAQNYPFHQLDLDDCLSRIQRPKIDEYKDYLVTLHAGVLRPLVKLFKDCQSNGEARQEPMGKDSGYLFYRIMDTLVDYCFPIVDKVMGNLEDIEDMAFDERVDAAQDVATLRRDIATQRRIIWSLKDIMMALERKVQRFTKLDLSIYFGDVNDHLNHLWNTLEEVKETVDIFKDADYILGQDRLQSIMTILTVIMAIMLPFSIISSIYGMNVPLPGSGAGGHPWAGWVLISIMTIITGAMLFFLHRRRWI